MEDSFRSGLFLIKDIHFPFDGRLNVRHILDKTNSFLKDHRVGDCYFSRLLINKCSYHGIDARILLCLIQLGSGLLSRSVCPDNKGILDVCLGLKPGRLPEALRGVQIRGIAGQIEAALVLLKRFHEEGDRNQGMPIVVEGKELIPLNAATYAVCSVIWSMGGGFRDILRFRKVYKELYQTKENDRPGFGRSAPDNKGPQDSTPGYSNP